MDSARLMVTRTIISREGIGEKILHRKYERDLSNILKDLGQSTNCQLV